MNRYPWRVLCVSLSLTMMGCSTGDDKGLGGASSVSPLDASTSDAGRSSDRGLGSDGSRSPTDMQGLGINADGGVFGNEDGSLGDPPVGGSIDAGDLGGSGDSGLDGNGVGNGGGGRGGGGDGSGECLEGFGGEVVLTDADGRAGNIIDVVIHASEDSSGYFALGLRLQQWTSDSAVSLTVSNDGLPVAEGGFQAVQATCTADAEWQITDLRLNALPSIEIDDIIELELEVTGEVSSGLAADPSIIFEGRIRLQY